MPERHSGRVFVVAIGAAALALALSMAGGAYAAGPVSYTHLTLPTILRV